jgi:hypothetical protein
MYTQRLLRPHSNGSWQVPSHASPRVGMGLQVCSGPVHSKPAVQFVVAQSSPATVFFTQAPQPSGPAEEQAPVAHCQS